MKLEFSISESASFKINHPIKNFYLKPDNSEFISDTDHITLYIGGSVISHTDQLTKISYLEEEFYRLDFFKNSLTLPMNQINYHDISLQRTVNYFEDGIMKKKITQIKALYYEIDDQYTIPSDQVTQSDLLHPSTIEFSYDNDNKILYRLDTYQTIYKTIVYPIVHMNNLLNYQFTEGMRRYGLDETWHNLLIVANGMCGLYFSN